MRGRKNLIQGINTRISGLAAACIYLLLPSVLYAQRVTGQSAAEAFASGDFIKAYSEYTVLLESFPRDPVYLYGAGASLVKMGSNPAEASRLLLNAITYNSAIRSVPADARFYLARAYHLEGRFSEAVREYDLFSSGEGRRIARELGVAGFIKECIGGQGALPVTGQTIPAIEAPVVEAVAEEDLTPATPGYIDRRIDSLLEKALSYLTASDSVLTMISHLEGQLSSAALNNRQAIRIEVDSLKRLLAGYSRLSDSLIMAAGLQVQNVQALQKNEPVKTGVSHISPTTDTIVIPSEKVSLPGSDVPVTHTTGGQKPAEPVTRVFAVKDQPFYSDQKQVPVNEAFPPGLHYTIQIAVFRNPVAPAHFRRLYPVFGIRNPGSELTFYYTGLFRRAGDAAQALPLVRNEGFKDAFVAIMMDGRQVSAERGAMLEKEWGTRGLAEWKGVVAAPETDPVKADTVPPTLLFRVEILKTTKPVTAQQLAEIERVAAGPGLEIVNPAPGNYAYLVGKFLTFESASSYADLLRRNGYREARVAAYLGNREIPVETAIKFFDR